MKRFSSVILYFFIFISFLLADNFYKITDINYDISGCGAKIWGKTKIYALEKKVCVDLNKIFESEEELNKYLFDYELRLNNLRTFETVIINHELNDSEENIIPVTLTVTIKDSFHFLGVPYVRYNSNEGTTFKLKLKDTNFLGTLNELNSEINFQLEQAVETEDPKAKFGFALTYDYPFKAGYFDGTWFNDHSFSYTVGETSPEWNAQTGVKFSLPLDNISYDLSFYQQCNKNFDYSEFDDELYFKEEVEAATPFKLFEIANWGDVILKPYVNFSAYWDKNGINENNTDLSSPSLKFGYSVDGKRINWTDNFRDGLSANLTNYFLFNFQRQLWYPFVSAELQYFKSFNLLDGFFLRNIGIATDFYAFGSFVKFDNPYFKFDGVKIGSRLRGIRDEQTYTVNDYSDWLVCQTPAAFVFNFDFPIHIFSTNFQKGFLRYFNFDFQLSPFIDMALTYNKYTKTWFNPKDGFYAAGLEVLVYPKKWSSFTVRGSIGIDIGRKLFANSINTEWRNMDISSYEISFGVGLHY